MWILFAFGSAVFAGLTAILAKCGVRRMDSTLATAIRTIVVLMFSWLMVFLTGAQSGLAAVEGRVMLFLVLSGLATGASWLCYFKALSMGDVNKVVGAGTFLMIEKKPGQEEQSGLWLPYALGSALFASLTAILGKLGVSGVDSNLATAIRTGVVLVMAWAMVLITGKAALLKTLPREELSFLCLSGLSTGASWLCYYRALQDGFASVVVPIDKLSILVTVAFSALALHERLSRKAGLGLALITGGTLFMLWL